MLGDLLEFLLRIGIITALAIFIWKLIQPQTQGGRIARATALVAALLAVLIILRAAGI